MASYIGKPISLISQSDIRYRGILHSVDPAQQTIQLSNVYSMGTENRRPVTEYIPPQTIAYDFILFRAPEVKDINVETAAPPPLPVNSVQNDPAIIGVSQGSAPAPQGYDGYGYNPNSVPPAPGSIPVQPSAPSAPVLMPAPAAAAAATTSSRPPPAQVTQPNSSHPPRRREANGRHTNTNTIRTALESVERAMGDLRVEAARSGRRPNEIQAGNIHVPSADFDFVSSNAKFNKAAVVQPIQESDSSDSESDAETNPSNAGDKKDDKKEKEKEKKAKEPAYNRTKSFFDSLTPNSLPPRGGGGGGGGVGHVRGVGRGGRGRGGYGRSRREEEAQRNLMTFGETAPPSQSPSWNIRRGGRRGGATGGYSTQGISTNGRPG